MACRYHHGPKKSRGISRVLGRLGSGSDGVFDNLFLDEILETANQMLPPKGPGYSEVELKSVAQRIVAEQSLIPNLQTINNIMGDHGCSDTCTVT